MRLEPLLSKVKSFLVQKEDGSATIEAVLWMPIFVFVLALAADAAMIYGAQAQALRIVQDANRSMSIGRLRSTEETQSFIMSHLSEISPNAQVTTTVQMGVITTRVMMPASDLSVTRMIPAFADVNVGIRAQHVAET